MTVTDDQVRLLMKERSKGLTLETDAAKAGMSRQTAAKYEKADRMPSRDKTARTWRTRENPFQDVWPRIEGILKDAPGVQAKMIFDLLQREHPGRFNDNQLRTLQRQVRTYRATQGKDTNNEVFFPQAHRPGEAMQTDFTRTDELQMTVQGESYAPLLCQSVLPYSKWRWATPTRSESTQALIEGVQAALFRLGAVPKFHQTDNSTGATHRVGSGSREFNDDYKKAMEHLGLIPRTTAVGKKEQNGSVEAHNGALKRLLTQNLLLRGSRDFESEKAFRDWLRDILLASNRPRGPQVAEEHEVMKPLIVERLRTYKTSRVRVTRNSTVRVNSGIYSVPPRLMGHELDVRVYDDRLDFYYASQFVQSRRRLLGRGQFDVDYRHIIWSLVRKPGAMERYCYRECLFPTLTFRLTYEVLQQDQSGTRGDAEYLRVLHLAASTLESEVETALKLLLEAGKLPNVVNARELISVDTKPQTDLKVPDVELDAYDALLGNGGDQ